MKPPNFIIGPAKCGTTTIAKTLDKHPDICLARRSRDDFTVKEFQWYGKTDDDEHYWPPARYRFDAAPQYFDHANFDKKCRGLGRETKVIMAVRHPADRFISHWHQLRTRIFPDNEVFQRPFLEMLEVMEKGKGHYKNIHWCSDYWNLHHALSQHFDDILVVCLENLENEWPIIWQWLGVEPMEVEPMRVNVGHDKPEVSRVLRKRLLKRFPTMHYAVERLYLPEEYLAPFMPDNFTDVDER